MDQNEKEMIGSILDGLKPNRNSYQYLESSESKEIDLKSDSKNKSKSKKLKLPNNWNNTSLQQSTEDPFESMTIQMNNLNLFRTYSPPIIYKNQKNSYEFDLQLTPILPLNLSAQTIPLFQNTTQIPFPVPSLFPPNLQLNPLTNEEMLEGDLILKCKDQANARQLQKIFQHGTNEQKDVIYNKLEKGLLILSKDVFGNYVIQNLLEFGTQIQRVKIVNHLMNAMIQLSFHTYGCRVVQKSLETTYQTEKPVFNQIFEQIRLKVRELVLDSNGNHVIQKIIQLEGQNVADWIKEGVQGQVKKLTYNSFGCRIIQKTIQISNPANIALILEEVMVIAGELCFSQFGNYIIQQLLQDAPAYIIDKIHNLIFKRFEELSLNKFGSNVVDQAIKYANNQFKRQIIQILLSKSNENNEFIFVRLSKSAFGNYVVQNFLKQVELDLLQDLYEKINSNPQLVLDIHQSQFGKFKFLNLYFLGQYVYQFLVKQQDLLKFRLQ